MDFINKLTDRQRSVFWSRVNMSGGADSCWPYNGYKDKDGYSHKKFGIDKVRMSFPAHRLALILHTGINPTDQLALHAAVQCHNPACCNPSHLRWGSAKDNRDDSELDNTIAKGERHGCAKLTEAQVLEIRQLYADGKRVVDIAKDFGFKTSTIEKICYKASWRHLL